MPMSFREKTQWIALLAVFVVFARYFAQALPAHGPDIAPQDVVRFIGAIVLLVVLQVVGQAALAIASRREAARGIQQDERDMLIGLRASRISLHVLGVAVFTALVTALTVPGNFAFVHVLFGGWVLAQVVELAARVAMYRRGA